MSQYQSFPDAAGASHTLEKLKSLLLPELAGRSFLDVGCNEGFFCGFAKFQGATRVLGIDHSAGFIERARRRFPGCEFRCQGWTSLPDERFDVILLASALHYAEDQAALLETLIDRLTPDGVLVLELGIASSSKAEWVRIKRGIDERYFPSMPKLRELLADHAWKWMGKSVPQAGDPVGRHVLHICRRRPVAYLLMEPPAYGKSSIARRLFGPAGVPVVSGDEMLSAVARGDQAAPQALHDCLRKDYSPFQIDQLIRRAFADGLGNQLVALWIEGAPAGDFALDVYVPAEYQALVQEALAARGYLPVTLRWDKVGPRMAGATQDLRAEAFYLSMVDAPEVPVHEQALRDPVGFVDEVALNAGRLEVRGWAISARGEIPGRIHVRIDERVVAVDAFDKQSRADVQRHFGLPHALFGFRFSIEAGGLDHLGALAGKLEVFDPDGASFRLSAPVEKAIADANGG